MMLRCLGRQLRTGTGQSFNIMRASPMQAGVVRPAGVIRAQSIALFSSSCTTNKSKRSFASEPAPDTPGEVPVTRTKGKGAKGVQKTTTTNDELPGEEFAEGKQKENMQRAVQRCRETVARLVGSHGRADPAVLEGVRVSLPSSEPPKAPTKNRQEAGPTVSIKELATIGVRDGALLVTCFDPSTLKYVERGIYNAELGLAPQHVTDGGEEGVLRVPIPRPTAESRAQLLKDVNNVCENARVSIRVARQTAKKQIDSDVKRKVIGKDESHLEMGRIEEETKNRTAEVNKIQEDTRKRLER